MYWVMITLNKINDTTGMVHKKVILIISCCRSYNNESNIIYDNVKYVSSTNGQVAVEIK